MVDVHTGKRSTNDQTNRTHRKDSQRERSEDAALSPNAKDQADRQHHCPEAQSRYCAGQQLQNWIRLDFGNTEHADRAKHAQERKREKHEAGNDLYPAREGRLVRNWRKLHCAA